MIYFLLLGIFLLIPAQAAPIESPGPAFIFNPYDGPFQDSKVTSDPLTANFNAFNVDSIPITTVSNAFITLPEEPDSRQPIPGISQLGTGFLNLIAEDTSNDDVVLIEQTKPPRGKCDKNNECQICTYSLADQESCQAAKKVQVGDKFNLCYVDGDLKLPGEDHESCLHNWVQNN